MPVRPLGRLLLLALTAAASPPVAGNALAETEPAIQVAMPEAALKKLRRNPAAHIASGAKVIAVHGAKGAIDGAAVERMIALDRARVRAGEVERFLRADLDADGLVTRQEYAALAAVSSAGRKAAMDKTWARADADSSGAIEPAELAAHAAAVATEKVTEAEADGWRAMLAFDRDGDAKTDVGELIAGVAALQDLPSGPDAGTVAGTGAETAPEGF